MAYIPFVPPSSSPPTPRTRDLADRLARVLVEFEETHPTVTAGEVREATRIALRTTRASSAVAPPVLGVLVGALLLGVVVLVSRGGFGGAGFEGSVRWVALAVVGLGILALVAALTRGRP